MLALEKKYHEKIEFIIVDVRTTEGNDLAYQYRVDYIPRFFLLDNKGNTAFTEVGVQSQSKLDSQISQTIAGK